MGDLFSNSSQAARDSLEDVLAKLRDGLQPDSTSANANLVANGGLTLKGAFIATNFAAPSTASIYNLNIAGSTSGFQEARTSIASIATANIYSPSATLNSLVLSSSILAGGATIAPLQVVASLASQAFFDFRGAVLSTASINLAANKVVGVVQVNFVGAGGAGVGFMPIFQGVS